jgi:hypothetical protein
MKIMDTRIKNKINSNFSVSFIFKTRFILITAVFLILAEFFAAAVLFAAPPVKPAGGTCQYPWLENYGAERSLASRIAPPAGFTRIAAESGSFAEWLRGLPLKDGNPPVYLYDKRLKSNQGAHYAVVDIGCGTRDLQQCADAIMRLRGEYLFSKGEIKSIKFNTGDAARSSFEGWLKKRPAGAGRAPNYQNFQKYMIYVFSFAGTYSMSRSLKKVGAIEEMRIGDIFIKGGFPGHAVLVTDIAENEKNGKKVFMLLQSYMPAQDMHILNNPGDHKLSPWYNSNFGESLETPEWDFTRAQLMRF